MSIAGLVNDVRVAVRSLVKEPGLTLAVVLTLAFGIGVNCSVGAVAYGVLFRALPYLQPERLVVVTGVYAGTEYGLPLDDVEGWRSRLRTVDSVAGLVERDMTLRGLGEPRAVRTALVTEDFFRVLGVQPESGRLGNRWTDTDAAVVSAGMKAGPGDHIGLGRRNYLVVAKMPTAFGFPSDDVDVWIPAKSAAQEPQWSTRDEVVRFRLIARLKSGASVAQLTDDARRVAKEVSEAGGATIDPEVASLEQRVLGNVKPLFWVFLSSAALVLLVACANVASLLVGRAVTRQGDLAVRLALGASPYRLVRFALAESAVLALAGWVVGTLLTMAALRPFVAAAVGLLPRLNNVRVDATVLVGSVIVTLLVAVLCATGPALYALRYDLALALNRASARTTNSGRRSRQVLVVTQVALSVVLLTTAALLSRTVWVLSHEDSGFKSEKVFAVRLALSDVPGSDGLHGRQEVARLLHDVAALGGVAEAAVASNLPPRVSPFKIGVRFASTGRGFQTFSFASVTPAYFRTLGIRVLQGRTLDDSDGQSEPTMVLSESAARVSGLRVGDVSFRLPSGLGVKTRPRVVGIVADVKYGGLDAPAAPAIYVPWDLLPSGVSYLVVQTKTENALALAGQVRQVIRSIEPRVGIPTIRSMDDELLDSMAHRRARMIPAVGFGGIAFAIALVGLFALTLRSVAERRRELAIRAAFGAEPARAVRLLMREGVMTSGVGLALGFVGSALTMQGVAPLLYGVKPLDIPTWLSVGIVVLSVALATTYASAREAASVDLMELLRGE